MQEEKQSTGPEIWVPEIFRFIKENGWTIIYKSPEFDLYRKGDCLMKITQTLYHIIFRTVDEDFKSDPTSYSGFNLSEKTRTRYEVSKFLIMLGYDPDDEESDVVFKSLATAIFCK